MADNVVFQTAVTATPPTTTTVATDDVSGVQYQRAKLDVGGDGDFVAAFGRVEQTDIHCGYSHTRERKPRRRATDARRLKF